MEFDNYRIQLLQLSDAKRLLNLIDSNRDRLLKYFPITSSSVTDLETATSYITKKIHDTNNKEFFGFLIEEKTTNELVGMYILKNFNWRIPKCELAYFIDKNHEGKGIVSKITKGMIDHCFEDLKMNKIWIETGEDNIGSKTVALKNGFKLEGLLRNNFRDFHGNLINIEYYGLTLEDWENNI